MSTPPYRTVTDAKVVKAPLEIAQDDGQTMLVFVRIGIRLEMADGSHWFQHKSGSWTHHFAGLERDPFDDSLVHVQRKASYSPRQLDRDFGNRPEFLRALAVGVEVAEALEAVKRAG